MKIYIYSFINKLNGHRYIGKTNNVERRKREHKSNAYNPQIIGTDKDCTWYKKIRQYGFENFDFEILEVASSETWREKERYWIEYYNTYKGVGYNETPGGDDYEHLFILTDDEAASIRELLQNSKISQKDIAEEYQVSSTLISNINQGQKYIDENLKYPLRKNYKTGLEEYSELITLLRTTTKSFKKIAEELSIAESSVKKINYGKMQFDPNMDYPIRKETCFTKDIDNIINDIMNTNLTLVEISKKYGKGIATIHRINKGKSHFNPKYSYPLRK